MATEIIYRITYPRVDGGEKAVRCLVKRLGWGVHTGAVLQMCERKVGSQRIDQILETRRFDRTGREVCL